jgi:hypothetical protein
MRLSGYEKLVDAEKIAPPEFEAVLFANVQLVTVTEANCDPVEESLEA